ncbi:hypothetical protein JCM9279_001163 [Rhodotorula babjevae]
MPVDTAAQPCEVCGVLTTQKCSACESAGISLFFCSRDHQKLVWPAHKLVCGPGKATPSKLVTSFRASLEELGRAPAQQVLDALDGDVYDVRRVLHKPFIVCLLYGGAMYDEDLKTFNVDNASAFCATLLSGMCHELVKGHAMPLDYRHTPWFSLFQHKIFIICRLAQLVARWPANAEARTHYSGAKDRTNAWLNSGLGTDDPVLRSIASKMRIVHGVETYESPR